MQAHTNPHPSSIRRAHQINRLISWGMPSPQRDLYLAETLADWEEMQTDRGSISVFLRALRGIPAGVWARLNEHDTTALPASIAITLLGLAGLGAGFLEAAYPIELRRFVLLSALGTFLGGASLLRDPRRVVLRRYRLPALMLSAGFVGMATNIPTGNDWTYDAPLVETPALDATIAMGFGLVGIGAGVLVLASFVTRRRPMAGAAGITVMIGTALFAIAHIIWGLLAVTTDPAITATSVGSGLAALSFLHVMPRLRKLEIV